MVKQKQVSKMKTSEIIDELGTDLGDERFTFLDEELESRTPFIYLKIRLDDIEEKLNKIISNFNYHHHYKGKLVREI
ncbi:MAG TPA: hypothetical protein VMZ91_00790 [Candidatus Paceibacterota bacterium]|nr:hypothetical protein [Candidatus Paceibacterota bacterium]